MPTRKTLLPLLLSLLCALPLASLGRAMWLDEFTTALTLAKPSFLAAMDNLRDDTHHPLYFALLYGWHRMFASLWADRLLGAWIHAATTLTLYRTANKLGGQRAAIWSACLFGLCPLALREATELRPYALLLWTCSFALAVGGPGLCRATPWRLVALRATAYVAVVGCHPVGIFFVVALAAVEFGQAAWPGGDCRTNLRERLVSLVAYVAAGLCFLALHWGYSRHVGSAGIDWMPQLSWQLLGGTLATFVGVHVPAPVVTGWGVLLGGTLLAAAAPKARAHLAVAAVYVALVLGYTAFVLPIFYYRSMLPLLPVAVLAGGLGLARSRGVVRRVAQLAVVGLLLGQAYDWAKVALLPVDQAHAVNVRLAQLLAPGDGIWVYPDWYDTTVKAELGAQAAREVWPLVSDNVRQKKAGVAVLRLDGYLADAPGGPVRALAERLPTFPHHLLMYFSDSDDVLQDKREREAMALDVARKVVAIAPACQVTTLPRQIVELDCRGPR